MSIAVELLSHVEDAGGVAEVRGERLHLSAPEPLPDNLMESLREHKSDVMGIVALLGMSLAEFERGECGIEIRVEWFPKGIWFVPTEVDAVQLVSEGENRGRIWTASELIDLLTTPGLELEDVRTIQAIKEEFDGHLAGVRKAGKQHAP
jgi:hypothetical protein